MSAFLCSEKHIAVLADFANKHDIYLNTRYDPDATNIPSDIAKAMAKANIKSVDHRYPDNADKLADKLFIQACGSEAGQFGKHKQYTPVEIIKAAQCLDYQSCEHDEWEQSNVKALLDHVISKATTMLPGYNDAPWGIDQPHSIHSLSVCACGMLPWFYVTEQTQ